MIAERVMMALLLGGIGIGCTVVLYPFISAILWASILTFTTWPAFMWARVQLRLGSLGAALLMVTVTAVVVVLPLALAIPGGADDAAKIERTLQEAMAAGLPGPPDWIDDIPLVGAQIAGLWTSWAADLSIMVEYFRPYFGIAAGIGLRVLLGLANGVLEFVLALIVAFFLYMSGEVLADRLRTLLRRIAGKRADRLITVTGATVRGVVYGILGTAVVQGMLTAFGLWMAGVPRPALLGVVAGGLSVLPVGAPIIWVPAGLWLMASGRTAWGIVLLVYGAVVISGADSVIRPYFIARGAKLPFLLTLLGVLGGAIAFGLLGVFVGPVLLGVGFSLVTEWTGRDDEVPEVTRIPAK
jgi:predicted PurR-regulated permease PerM